MGELILNGIESGLLRILVSILRNTTLILNGIESFVIQLLNIFSILELILNGIESLTSVETRKALLPQLVNPQWN